jgi:hypothetical protein
MADGTNAAASDLKKGDDGVLRNKNGVHAALDGDGKPLTVGKAATAGGNAMAAGGQREQNLPAPAPTHTPAPAPAQTASGPAPERHATARHT